MMKRQYTIYNICVLLALLFLGGGWNVAWGQYEDYTITHQYADNYGRSTEVVYVRENVDKTISFQDGGAADNIDGYIRWYIKRGNTETTAGLSRLQYRNNYNQLVTYTDLTQYANGWVWYRTELKGNATAGACSIIIDASALDFNETTPDTLIVEASGMNNVTTQTTDGGQIYITRSPEITFQRKYVIRNAKNDESTITGLKKALDDASSYDNWKTIAADFRALAALTDEDRRSYFIESYELHTPLSQGDEMITGTDNKLHPLPSGTNYRLSRQLSNYNIPGSGIYSSNHYTASRVRWNIFKADGNRIGGDDDNIDDDNIWEYTFTEVVDKIDEDADTTQVIYLVAEVANATTQTNNLGNRITVYRSDWYPVAFIKVYLEPHSEPLIQSELDQYSTQTTSSYYRRTDQYLEDNNFRELTSITFDNDIHTGDMNNLQPSDNYSSTPLQNATTYYAYAYPGEFEHRRNNRFSVGRGEYGLYRTLNYTNISEGDINGGMYNDYFAKDYTKSSEYERNRNKRYDKWIADRLYDRTKNTGNTQMGYFMYLDAADTPGTIANIGLPDDLCPDTRLVISAWICDMAFKDYYAEGNDISNADVSFTFKGVTENGDEVILNRYQSGRISNNPYEFGNSAPYIQANWQQVYFTFTFDRPEESFVSYVVEIANNAASSTGADYAIDDIRIYRSTPNIDVIREDACDASTLTISSDYTTLLANMDWTEGEDISDVDQVSLDPSLLKYRFGLQGLTTEEGYPIVDRKIGNTYFSFLEGLTQVEASGDWVSAGKTDVTEQKTDEKLEDGEYRWIRINKNLATFSAQSAYSLRVVVSTDIDVLEDAYDDAQKRERILNLRALNDYNYAVANWAEIAQKMGVDATADRPEWLGDSPIATTLTEEILSSDNISSETLELYSSDMQELYKQLLIPRIRVPWYDKTTNTLYLSKVDVSATDLKTQGEVIGYDETGKQILADGHYQVILFDALEVQNGAGDDNDYMHDHDEFLKKGCNLISDFYVGGSIRIRVYAETGAAGLICEGTQRHVEAELLDKDTREPLDESLFGFDWFLGTMTEYEDLTKSGIFGEGVDLASAIRQFRGDTNANGSFTGTDVRNWKPDSNNAQMQEGLLDVIDDERGLLRTGVSNFTLILDSESIVAMPYVKTGQTVDGTLYCTEVQEVLFDEISTEIPEIHPGIPSVDYKTLTQVPLRLGLRHVQDNVSLTVPLQKEISFAVSGTTGHFLIMNPNNTTITLNGSYDGVDLPEVARLAELKVKDGEETNSLKLTFNKSFNFREGETYTLLIPFSESADGQNVLGTTCDGLARLIIRIVPEYLTWEGESTDKWYIDGNWNQSSESELYMLDNDDDDDDANGNDEDLTRAFSPLYFSKVTLPENGSQLVLEQPKFAADGKTLFNPGDGVSIQYEMAVDTLKGDEEGYMSEQRLTINPYYINKVSEIYFKPEATLMNQHYLEYDTARVEFTMERNKAYWMASPLHGVYAGDMYAPYENGIQNTPAFQYILFDYGDNSPYHRWELPFYQKAWNKEVAYSKIVDPYTGTPNAGDIISVDAVKSNWSIEYNDVWVPYTIGKGFYMRVDEKEGDAVTVRLPKADSDYIYQVTKAGLSGKGDRTNAGRLATTLNDGIVEVDLKKVYGETALDVGESEARHFLVGNPYMTYLNMAKFLEVNSDVLNDRKYWTLANGAPSAVVGTPDVEFSGENGTLGSVSGMVKPMEAFFIEVKAGTEDTNLKVTFTPEMMSSSEITATAETRSYSATNPTLTITAERGETKSVAKLVTSDTADNGYETSEDAVVLLDSELDAAMVYTVSGSRAAQVNAMKEISNVGLGIYNENDDEATVTISGLSQMASPLYLYDAQTRKSVELEGDSYTMQITGDSHGRYYLRNSAMADELENTISIYSAQRGQVIVSALQPVREIKVFNVSGALVRQFSVNTTQYTFPIQSGLYIIYASDGEQEQTEKVIVR